MFWKFPNLVTSHIDTLLEKEDVTLQELLDEDDVLQECKAQNKKLIDFLVSSESMEELVNLVTQEPEEDTDERCRYKFPNTACELLTSDVSQISDKLASEEDLLNKVYAFLEAEGPLNPLLASFFSKVMGLLITRKSETILEFLQSKEDFMGLLMHHMGTSAIMDLLLRIITCIENQIVRTSAISWLNDQGLVKRLVAMIDPSVSEEKQCNASQSLCDIIRLNREQMSQLQDRWQDGPEADPLLLAIESEEMVSELLGHMLDGEKRDSVIASGLAVIQTLLEFKKIGGMIDCSDSITGLDTENLTTGAINTLKALTPRLKDMHKLLIEPPKQHYNSMPTTIGTLDPPLGNTRLQIVRLVGTLLITNTASVNEELGKLGVMNTILDLHFKYVWNNFLHTQVEMCIGTILTNSPAEVNGEKSNLLVDQLFTEYRIVQKILDYWEDNEQHQSRPGGHRRGYMGHLTKIANHITHSTFKGNNVDRIKELLKEPCEGDNLSERWDKFVSGTLSEVNKQNTVELVGSHPSSEDDDADFRDIAFPADAAMQQAFSDYQLQQMTSNFIDQFGFNEEEFAEQDERVDAPFNEKISSISFDINSDDTPSSTLFEQACNARIQQFDDTDSDEDLWEEKEITFSQGANTQQNSSMQSSGVSDTGGGSEDSDGSTDSEEDLDSPTTIHQTPANTPTTVRTEKMDVDSSEVSWRANFEDVAVDVPIAMDTSPWSGSSPQTVTTTTSPSSNDWAKFNDTAPAALASESAQEDEDWADFTQFTPLQPANINRKESDSPRSNSPVAMDTAEVGSRPEAYLVKSAPADLASSVDAAREELSTSPDSTNQKSSITASTLAEEPASSVSSSETSGSEAEAAQPVCSIEQLTPVAESSLPDSTSDTVIASAVGMPGTFHNTDDFDDDLEDNFDFLASAGLMKSPESAVQEEAETDSKSQHARLEEARALAKSALEQFADATQNGPV